MTLPKTALVVVPTERRKRTLNTLLMVLDAQRCGYTVEVKSLDELYVAETPDSGEVVTYDDAAAFTDADYARLKAWIERGRDGITRDE